ncbi:MAG: ComEC/Rec2 family competence protein [Planctomycetota bacterium]|nr:ComEC/Rec2 family competence protein [Planctomycetota bacterium]
MGNAANQISSLSCSLSRRPFLSAAALFILGIFAHAHVAPRPALYLCLATSCVLLCLLTNLVQIRRPRIAIGGFLPDALLAASVLLAGTTTAQLESSFYPPHHIAHFTSDQAHLAQLEMRITQRPRTITNSQSGRRPSLPHQITQAEVLRVRTTTGWQPATGTITIQIAEPVASLAIAQHIKALGTLFRPLPATNPGQFDWANYYRDQRILASFHIRSSGTVQILASPRPTLLDSLRQSVRNTLESGFSPDQSLDHALLRALVLGDSDPQLRDVQDYFVRTGTSHHLAISGMHIAVLGALVLGFCRLLLLRPRVSVWISLLFVIVYGLVALPSPPVVRSVLLCVACGVGMLSRRSLDGVQLLALSVFAMLVYHPLDLYNAGFQLSFGTVLGLMFFARPTLTFLRTRNIHDQVAAAFRKPTAFQSLASPIRRHLLEGTVAGVIAWLVSAPLIALHFNQLNPYAIPASLILAIPVFLGLVGGFLKIIFTLLIPPFAPYFADLAALPISLMRRLVELLAQIPGNDAPFARPPLWSIFLFYLLLALPLLLHPRSPAGTPSPSRSSLRRLVSSSLRFTPLLAILCILFFPLLLCPASTPPGQFRLTLLSIGTGQCAVVQLPSNKIIFIDAGSSSYSDISHRTVAPFLKSIGLSQIDSLFISHANIDHFSAASEAIATHSIQHVYVSCLFQTHAASDPLAAGLLQTLGSRNLSPQILAVGQKLPLDPDTTLEVLWPPSNYPMATNDSSLVLRLTCHGRSILFPGDIERLAQMELLVKPQLLRSDVLIAPHHGSSVRTTAQFLAAVNPEVILASNDHTLTSRQLYFDTLATRCRVYRTGTSGAVTLTIPPTGELRLTTFLRNPLMSNQSRPTASKR